jgi:malonyl-CoA/methylmalonyl-CoA synthetase
VDSYKWTPDDFMLNTLPLNHYSGLIYCLMTPFFVGAQVELLPKFNAELVWSKLLDTNSKVNMFIAVPTIYRQLVDTYRASEKLRAKYSEGYVRDILKMKMRLIGSGSAPLNIKTYEDWSALTGYNILERYGMTEIGMALSSPYIENEKTKRLAGYVGKAYGRVRTRIVSPEDEHKVLVESDWRKDDVLAGEGEELVGELQVKGPTVFKEYFNQPLYTKNSFTDDGWFKTGDF